MQLFSTSVNSPLKLNDPKAGAGNAPGARKTSLSAINQAGSARPGTRRRDTSDSFAANGPLSPTESKTFFRNEPTTSTPPPALLRRRTDFQDEAQEKEEAKTAPDNESPFGILRRSGTGGPPSAGLNPPAASPWSAGPPSAFSSMGAFGTFNTDVSSGHDTPDKRPGFGSARGGSRFKDILAKTTAEDMSPSVKEKSSFNALGKLPEEDDAGPSHIRDAIKNRPNRSETNPYDDLMPRTGSAALSSHEEQGIEQMGFSAFNSARDLVGVDNRTPHHRLNHEPMSPTNTNPYQSPQAGRMPEEEEGHDGQVGMAPFGRRDVFAGGENRGHASFGSIRGMGGMGGLGGLAGWGNPAFGAGTPGRERPAVSAAFGDPVFSPLTELQSPGAFGGNNLFAGGAGFGGPTRQNKLSSIFPPAMQEQMRSDSRNDAFEGRNDPFESASRRPESFRGTFDEMKRPGDDAFGHPSASQTPVGPPRQSSSAGPDGGSEGSSSGQMPTAQQRQMVMPDRMRWVYRDPHGQVQGPWSGLEMHDWFKAGFFTAELQVKKLEDADYEPLAQLVRRIGNSREPFLVPQIGVPHGPSPGGQQGNPWTAGGPAASAAQPPFASSFPSFGTTLTADQQNALERRKQEEQYLMARQKEFLTQRQVFMHGQHLPNAPHNMHSLQHHSSAHSLHSQPSFGSITSPAGYQPSPLQAPIQPPHPGHGFPSMTPTSAVPPSARDDDLPGHFGRIGLADRGPYGAGPSNQQSFAAHERNRLSMEQQQAQLQAHDNTFLGQQGRNERLEEFHELRGNMDEVESLSGEEPLPQPIGSQRPTEDVASVAASKQPTGAIGQLAKKSTIENEPLSLTQQVQRTAAANKQAAEEAFPLEVPPVSISPLPAPAAQRTRPPVAEALAAESRSAAQTPIETPGASVAPWADKTAEMPKGPSLKEIQEAEAKRAAEQEAMLAETRRFQAEQERLAAAQAPPSAPGLPSTSTWASSGSPSTPTTPGGSVWAKPVSAKPVSGVAPKKTLAQIQKEEEARKQRAVAQAAANAQATAYANPAAPSGNRYAQMASKASPAQSPAQSATHNHTSSQSTGSGAWTTVGSGGKPKTPATVVAAPPPTTRVVSSNNMAPSAPTRPTLPPSRSTSLATGGAKEKAMDELAKWSKAQLVNGMKAGISADDIVRNLGEMPAETEIIFEIIFSSSEIMDARRFADEYVRRRKLAERGIVDPNNATMVQKTPVNGGWNEVAKKGPTKEETTAASGFKVVSKKKGKK